MIPGKELRHGKNKARIKGERTGTISKLSRTKTIKREVGNVGIWESVGKLIGIRA